MKTIASDYAPPKRILYVEENDDSREMLALTLEKAGYAVSTADSITNGLNVTRRERFDLYILENSYRDDSALNLCRQIRANDPVIPIIFYSSHRHCAAWLDAASPHRQPAFELIQITVRLRIVLPLMLMHSVCGTNYV